MNNSNSSDKKRRRSDTVDEIQSIDDENENDISKPAYGTQQYWDNRYQSQFQTLLKDNKKSVAEKSICTLNNLNWCTVIDDKKSSSSSTRLSSRIGSAAIIPEKYDQDNSDTNHDSQDDNNKTVAYHSWYFTYNDLRPLILPLIFGGTSEDYCTNEASTQHDEIDNNDNVDYSFDNKNDNDDEADNNSKKESTKTSEELNNEVSSNKETKIDASINPYQQQDHDDNVGDFSNPNHEVGDDEEDYDDTYDHSNDHDDEDDDDDDNEPNVREGLIRNGPIRVLEVGCGDVPLGVELYKDVVNHNGPTNHNFPSSKYTSSTLMQNIVTEILCTDYSPVVINAMKQQHCTYLSNNNNYQTIKSNPTDNPNKKQFHEEYTKRSALTSETPSNDMTSNETVQNVLKFAITDARSFPRQQQYSDGSFQLILEKGTLDAMLSDPIDGVSNCIQIVSECARLLSPAASSSKTTTTTKSQSSFNKKEEEESNTPLLVDSPQSEPIHEKVPLSPSLSKEEGYLVIVSHLNAQADDGMKWLHEVVVEGLLQSTTNNNDDGQMIEWEIEVHGNSSTTASSSSLLDDDHDDDNKERNTTTTDDDDDDNDSNGPVLSKAFGPAVYIIHKCYSNSNNKKRIGTNKNIPSDDHDDTNSDQDDGDTENSPFVPVSIKFCSYE